MALLDDMRKDLPDELNGLNDFQALKKTYDWFGAPKGESFDDYANRILGTKGFTSRGAMGSFGGGAGDMASSGLGNLALAGLDSENDFHTSLRKNATMDQQQEDEHPWAHGFGEAAGAIPMLASAVGTGGSSALAGGAAKLGMGKVASRLAADGAINALQAGAHSFGQDFAKNADVNDIDPKKAGIEAGIGGIAPTALSSAANVVGGVGKGLSAISNLGGDHPLPFLKSFDSNSVAQMINKGLEDPSWQPQIISVLNKHSDLFDGINGKDIWEKFNNAPDSLQNKFMQNTGKDLSGLQGIDYEQVLQDLANRSGGVGDSMGDRISNALNFLNENYDGMLDFAKKYGPGKVKMMAKMMSGIPGIKNVLGGASDLAEQHLASDNLPIPDALRESLPVENMSKMFSARNGGKMHGEYDSVFGEGYNPPTMPRTQGQLTPETTSNAGQQFAQWLYNKGGGAPGLASQGLGSMFMGPAAFAPTAAMAGADIAGKGLSALGNGLNAAVTNPVARAATEVGGDKLYKSSPTEANPQLLINKVMIRDPRTAQALQQALQQGPDTYKARLFAMMNDPQQRVFIED